MLETAREILRYLVSNPESEDTLEGITRWWLQRERIERGVGEVRESVQLLLSRGLIMERRRKAGRASYHMNPAKRGEIVEFVE